jgi:cell division protein ZipA
VESLRWILLTVGIIFVLVIFILGKKRRKRNHLTADELEDDLPEFSARRLDDMDEGVGEVRVVTSVSPGDGLYDEAGEDDISSLNVSLDNTGEIKADADSAVDTNPVDIIVLYILPKGKATLAGAEINSSAQAMGLTFGEMNIFHYVRDGRNVFALANMLEPGSFDADSIHDLKTSGLTLFMRIEGEDPLDDLTEMLQRSYQLAGLLDARLCNHKREPLTEQDAENYRTQVNNFVASATAELPAET